nr:hypothetical protein [Tanacetum cinerariifolium]
MVYCSELGSKSKMTTHKGSLRSSGVCLITSFNYRRKVARDAEEKQKFSEKVIVLLLTIDAIELKDWSLALERNKGKKKKELSPQDAAMVIQITFREYLVRRSQSLRELAVAKGKLKELREFDIVVNDRRNKKLKEVVITLLPLLDFQIPRIVDSISIALLKGSCSELFTIVIGLKEEKWTSASVSAVYVFKLDINNMSPAITSSELGGYVHILSDDGKIIYSYHVKDKTVSLSSIPCVAGKNHLSAWAMLECTQLKTDRVYVDCKQEKEGDKEDGILVRSVMGNHQ